MKRLLTLCLIYQHPKILLGLKKRGFGEGRWNGFGGKVEEGESIEGAARRELLEEVGLEVESLEKVGLIDFEFLDETKNIEMHIFRGQDFIGEPTESEEMKPQWFDIGEIPLKNMWPDDKYWLPIFLEGKKFSGKFIFDHPSTSNFQSNIIEKIINEVEEI